MTRITVNVNDEWLDAAQEVLGTDTKVATINAALHAFALRRQAADLISAFESVQLDLADSGQSWGYGGGRDLSTVVENAREERAA